MPRVVFAGLLCLALATSAFSADLFISPAKYQVGRNPLAGASADFNHDGNLDIVIADSQSNGISVLPGNGDGTFSVATHYAASQGPAAVALGELNGDGKLDIVTAAYNNLTGISVALGNGDGTFQAVKNYGNDFYSTAAIAAGDFNGEDRYCRGGSEQGLDHPAGDGRWRISAPSPFVRYARLRMGIGNRFVQWGWKDRSRLREQRGRSSVFDDAILRSAG